MAPQEYMTAYRTATQMAPQEYLTAYRPAVQTRPAEYVTKTTEQTMPSTYATTYKTMGVEQTKAPAFSVLEKTEQTQDYAPLTEERAVTEQIGETSPYVRVPYDPILPIILPPFAGGPQLGAPTFKAPRFSRLPMARVTVREDAIADLASKTRAEAVLKRPARSPDTETALKYSKSSLGLRVPTFEEISGQLGRAVRTYKTKRSSGSLKRWK
jgi:hypothetical protein